VRAKAVLDNQRLPAHLYLSGVNSCLVASEAFGLAKGSALPPNEMAADFDGPVLRAVDRAFAMIGKSTGATVALCVVSNGATVWVCAKVSDKRLIVMIQPVTKSTSTWLASLPDASWELDRLIEVKWGKRLVF